jgi:hypothetical protein
MAAWRREAAVARACREMGLGDERVTFWRDR